MTTYRYSNKIEEVLNFVNSEKKELEEKYGYDAVKEMISGLYVALEILGEYESEEK